MKPSISSPKSTTNPLSSNLATIPSGSAPELNCSLIFGHGSSTSCLTPRLMRLFSASTSSTMTSMSSPLSTTSDGCSILFVQLMSDTWTNPSIPASISTNAPNDVRFRTTPASLVPPGYFTGKASHGSSSICFMPREIFSSPASTLSTTASMSSPIDTTLDGCRTFRVHDISEI